MRKRNVIRILRRYNLIPLWHSNKDIGWIKIEMGCRTWKDFLVLLTFTAYLNDKLPPEGIFIKELNTMFGGTITVDAGKINFSELSDPDDPIL